MDSTISIEKDYERISVEFHKHLIKKYLERSVKNLPSQCRNLLEEDILASIKKECSAINRKLEKEVEIYVEKMLKKKE